MRTVPPQHTMGNRIICRRKNIPGKLWSTPTEHSSGRNTITSSHENQWKSPEGHSGKMGAFAP